MKEKIELLLVSIVLVEGCAVATSGETVTAREVEGHFYSKGKMERTAPQFEMTYSIEGDIVTRTRVSDLRRKKVVPDNTIYRIQRNLSSDPSNGLSLDSQSVIRAVGNPGADAVEILIISDSFIQSVKSTSDYLVITRMKRLK